MKPRNDKRNGTGYQIRRKINLAHHQMASNRLAMQNCLQQIIPSSLHHMTPRHWYKIGDILVLRLNPLLEKHYLAIAQCFTTHLPHVRIVAVQEGPTTDWARKPALKAILGDGPNETVHREGGCTFFLDPFQILFSPGNKREREYLPSLIKPGEVIVDMFSCVGQFTIPLAVHAAPSHVYAIEKNPLAFSYLQRNLAVNGIENVVTPILGDAAIKTPRRVADRVIMGLIPIDPLFYLPKAIQAIKTRGIIHFHASYPKDLVRETLEHRLALLPSNLYRLLTIGPIRTVKKFAPSILHVVADLEVTHDGDPI